VTWTAALLGLRGNKIGMALKQLHGAENDLAVTLLRLSDTHKAEHEVFHVARDLARWSQEHVRAVAAAGHGYGVDLDPEPGDPWGPLSRVLQVGSEALGHRPEPGLLLLAGLRHVHVTAAGVSLDWEILAQTAQAIKDDDLLALSQQHHPQTLRQLRWANAKLKESAPQVMTSR
jgi:hypothetical protein